MFDTPALLLAILVAAVIVAALHAAHRGENTGRGWIVAGALALGLILIGVIDLLRYAPRETHFTTVIVGVLLPVSGTLGFLRGTRKMRRVWLRLILAFLVAFVLLVGGLQIGATVASRLIPF